jgi:perosamine synthetase
MESKKPYKQRILTLKDRKEWSRLVDATNEPDVYFTPEYASIYEEDYGKDANESFCGESLLFFFGNDDEYILYPFVRRSINDLPFLKESGKSEEKSKEAYDIISHYGYSGPIIKIKESKNEDDKKRLVKGFMESFREYCRKKSIITEFVRFHPLLKNDELFREFVSLDARNETVFVDLTKDIGTLSAELNKKTRNSIKKAEKNNVKIEISSKKDYIKTFTKIYNNTMERNKASSKYFLPNKFFDKTASELRDNLLLFVAKKDNKIISGALFMQKYGLMHYHFSGTDNDYSSLAPNDLILWKAIQWGKEHNCRKLHLGGGVSNDDSLFKFKAGFSKDRSRFYSASIIHDKGRYDELCKLKDSYETRIRMKSGEQMTKDDLKSGFFPNYRKTISKQDESKKEDNKSITGDRPDNMLKSDNTLKIPLFKVHYEESDIKAVENVIRRGTFWADGPEIREFEKKIKEYLGVNYCVAFNSGTSALHSILQAFDIKGHEVIVPSFTFIATSNAVVLAGGKPVFAESEDETFGLDAADVQRRITDKTKAVVLIHYGGCACRDTEKLRKITEKNKILLIEDAAQSLGATINGRKTGTFGDGAIFSLCQNKIITTGEGGFAVTDDRKIAERMKRFRSHGRVEAVDGDYFATTGDMDYIEVGYNNRLPTMSAALGISQLNNIGKMIILRKEKAAYLDKKLKDIKGIIVPKSPKGFDHVYQMYTIMLSDKDARDKLQKHLESKGIMTKVYFNPIHLKTFYRREYCYKEGMLPFTEKLSERSLTLPMYPDLEPSELDHIIQSIKEFFEKKGEQKQR